MELPPGYKAEGLPWQRVWQKQRPRGTKVVSSRWLHLPGETGSPRNEAVTIVDNRQVRSQRAPSGHVCQRSGLWSQQIRVQ